MDAAPKLTIRVPDETRNFYLSDGRTTVATVWGRTRQSLAHALAQAYAARAVALLNDYRAATNKAELVAAHSACDALMDQIRAERERLEPFIEQPDP